MLRIYLSGVFLLWFRRSRAVRAREIKDYDSESIVIRI